MSCVTDSVWKQVVKFCSISYSGVHRPDACKAAVKKDPRVKGAFLGAPNTQAGGPIVSKSSPTKRGGVVGVVEPVVAASKCAQPKKRLTGNQRRKLKDEKER